MTRGTPFGWLAMLAVLGFASWRLAAVVCALASIYVVASSSTFSRERVLPDPAETKRDGVQGTGTRRVAAEDAVGPQERGLASGA